VGDASPVAPKPFRARACYVGVISRTFDRRAARRRPLAFALAGVLMLAAGVAEADTAHASTGASSKPPASATLEGCVTAVSQLERSATFAGEMTAVPGTAHMLMRIDVLERAGGAVLFRPISYPGLGVWLRAAPGVKTYKNLNRVTDLSAPAFYRAQVLFRWMNAKGHLIKSLELRTPRCQQPAPPAPAVPTATPPTEAGAPAAMSDGGS